MTNFKFAFIAGFTILSTFSLSLFSSNTDHSPLKGCVRNEGTGVFYVEHRALGQVGTFQKQEDIEIKTLRTGKESSFRRYELKKGDCLVFHPAEARKYKIINADNNNQNQQVIQPAILFKDIDRSKSFGFFIENSLAKISFEVQKQSSQKNIIDYLKKNSSEIVVLLALCTKSRNDYCTLDIYHHGKKINKKPFKALNRSHRKQGDGRLHFGGDTPQGIYTLWASMFTEAPEFGGVSRIDLDAAMAPINHPPYNINSFLLEHLIPQSVLNEYWINEWPLAFAFGRVFLRIHANSIDPNYPSKYVVPGTKDKLRPTQGCLNLGSPKQMMRLFDLLISTGVFEKQEVYKTTNPNPLAWKVSPKIGKAFLIVKDV